MPHTAYIDGGARGNPGPAAAGAQIVDPSGRVIFSGGLFLGHQTNNEAEYAGLLLALDLLHAAGVRQVRIRSDSELLVRQMQGRYRVKAANLKPLYDRAAAAMRRFDECRFEHVPRERNKDADGLVNQALDATADVVPVDAANLLSQIDRRSVVPTPGTLFDTHQSRATRASGTNQGQAGGPSGGRSGTVMVSTIRPPRPNACPARIRAGEVFQFADTVPAGLCVQACAATIEAVLALQSIAADPDAGPLEPITATCPECGAVFQVNVKS